MPRSQLGNRDEGADANVPDQSVYAVHGITCEIFECYGRALQHHDPKYLTAWIQKRTELSGAEVAAAAPIL